MPELALYIGVLVAPLAPASVATSLHTVITTTMVAVVGYCQFSFKLSGYLQLLVDRVFKGFANYFLRLFKDDSMKVHGYTSHFVLLIDQLLLLWQSVLKFTAYWVRCETEICIWHYI